MDRIVDLIIRWFFAPNRRASLTGTTASGPVSLPGTERATASPSVPTSPAPSYQLPAVDTRGGPVRISHTGVSTGFAEYLRECAEVGWDHVERVGSGERGA